MDEETRRKFGLADSADEVLPPEAPVEPNAELVHPQGDSRPFVREGGSFAQDESGLWVPVPDGKKCISVRFANGTALDVEGDDAVEFMMETWEKAMNDEPWVVMRDAVHGERLILTHEGAKNIVCVGYGFLDLEAMRKAQEQQRVMRLGNRQQRRHPLS